MVSQRGKLGAKVLNAMELAILYRMQQVWFESDSLVAVQTIKGKYTQHWMARNCILKIEDLTKKKKRKQHRTKLFLVSVKFTTYTRLVRKVPVSCQLKPTSQVVSYYGTPFTNSNLRKLIVSK